MNKKAKGLILLLITFVFLYFVFRNINFKELLQTFKFFNYKYVILLIISITISTSFRALCFKQLIYKTIPDAKFKSLLNLCLIGACLNIFLPARAGDIFRAYYTGHKYNADKMKLFGSIMLERLFDVIVIFSLLALGIFVYNKNPLAISLCSFTGILIIFGVLFAICTYKFNNIDKICTLINNKTTNLPFHQYIEKSTFFINKTCNSFFNGFEIIDSPKRILFAITSSIGIWFFECINYLIIINGFGYNIHWSVSLFVIGFIALACMIPSTSIFIGPYQIAVISAFSIYNLPKESALAISVLEQSIVTIFLSVITFIFLIRNNLSLSLLKTKISNNIE